jgi:hypothetical protein
MAARAAHRRYCTTAWRQQGGGDGEMPADLTDEAATDVADPELAHILAGDCLLPLSDRQELLEETCPMQRLQLIRRSMTREAVLLAELRAVWAPSAKFAVEHSPN